MRYSFDSSFHRSLTRFDPAQQLELKRRLWEIRSGLAQRVLYWRTRDEVCFTFVGNHEEVRRFLKHLR